MRKWMLLAFLILVGCDLPLTPAEQQVQWQATAAATGCWPYAAPQTSPPAPPTETALATATATMRPSGPTPIPIPTSEATATPIASRLMPTCTPLPMTPTLTASPTLTPTPVPPRTPHPPASIGGVHEVGQQPGWATAWGRWSKTPMLAIDDTTRTAAVAWIAWGAQADSAKGEVWVEVERQSGFWSPLQTVNVTPVTKFYGGLGLTITPDGVVHLAWGEGRGPGSPIWTAASVDHGETWTAPAAISGTRGRVLTLTHDHLGGLHLLYAEDDTGPAAYLYAAPGQNWNSGAQLGNWGSSPVVSPTTLPSAGPTPRPQEAAALLGGDGTVTGELQLLERPDGVIRRVVLTVERHGDASKVVIRESDDGVQWTSHMLPTNEHLADEEIVASSLLVVPRGDGLIAAAWSQTPGPGNARGGIYAALSLDGGATWSGEEIIAQHRPQGELGDDTGFKYHAGFEPSLVYDQATDEVVAAWLDEDMTLRNDPARWMASTRVVLSARTLGADGRWQFAVTPETADTVQPVQLAAWGFRGALWGTTDGRSHYVTLVDDRNDQHRVSVRRLSLEALLHAGAS